MVWGGVESGEGGGAVDDLAADHGEVGGDLWEGVEGGGQGVLGPDDEVGELAGRDRALAVLLEGDPGGVQGHGAQGFLAGDDLAGADDLAGVAGGAGEGGPE